MKKEKIPISINIIYWFTNILLGMMAIVFFGLLIFNIILFATNSDSDLGFSLPLPIKIDYLETGIATINNQEVQLELQEGSTRINFVNPPRYFSRGFALAAFFALLYMATLTLIFRKYILNVREGKVFTVNNIMLIKWLSYGLVGVWFFRLIGTIIMNFYVVNNIVFDQIKLSNRISIGFTNNSGILIVAIFIWVLAHIFITGLKLQEEKNLTI